MKILGFLAKPIACRSIDVALLLLGIAVCSGNARPTRNEPVSPQVSEGIVTTSARQSESPAFIREATFGIEDDTDNCTPSCIALNRIVLRNRSDVPITSYRLAWIIVFADPKKPAEVHLGNSIALIKEIGPKQEREFSDNLAPLVQTSPTIRMICYFVAEVQQKDGRAFTEDRNKIASDQYDQVWTPSKTN
jgi:hypothetical protein